MKKIRKISALVLLASIFLANATFVSAYSHSLGGRRPHNDFWNNWRQRIYSRSAPSYSEIQTQNSGSFGEGMVSLNFDDGLPSFWENAMPILDKYGLKATSYVISGEVGNSDSMTKDQLLQLQQNGYEIGAHTKTHRDLTTLSAEEQTDEIAGSKDALEQMGLNIKTFSYPFGLWDSQADQIVKNSGYAGARTATEQDGVINYKNGDPFLLKTRSVEAGTSIDQVKQWIDQAKQDKAWLILVFHGVDYSGGQYAVAPEFLEEVANYISSSGIKTVTNEQGIEMMSQ